MKNELTAASIPSNEKTSSLLKQTMLELAESKASVSVDELLLRFQRRSYGGVLLLLAILCLIPGVSVFAGVMMIWPASQLFWGLPAPKFPRYIGARLVTVEHIERLLKRVIPWIELLEKIVKPRWPLVTSDLARKMIGLFIMFLAVIVAIPFPLSNFPPAVAVFCFALALLERDGLFVFAGIVVGAVASTIGVGLFYVFFAWLQQVL